MISIYTLLTIAIINAQAFQEYDLSYIDLNNGKNLQHLSKYIRTLDLYKVVKTNLYL